MKTTLLHITFFLVTVSTFGQTQLLKDYDFNNGGYYILGTFSKSVKNSLRDSIGEFYTNDITLLNKFKKDWTFRKPEKNYAGGYHYTVFVCKHGQILESFSINLNSEVIVTDNGYLYFDLNLLRQFYGKLKKPYIQRHSFTTIQEAREFRKSILNATTLIMTPKPMWTDFEGSFRFTYKCKEGTKVCIDEEEKIFKSIEAEIKKKYPYENFILDNAGGSWTTKEVQISCNNSLSDSFVLYCREKEGYFSKWKPFDLELMTYWTTKKK